MRGDLERMMILIKNLNGNLEADVRNINEFIEKYEVEVSHLELKRSPFGNLGMKKLVGLYEHLEVYIKSIII